VFHHSIKPVRIFVDMFLVMSGRFLLGALSASLLAIAPATAIATSTAKPTQAQIAKAVSQARRSKDLWATVNVCNTRRHPNTIGIRADMPALGFFSTLYMDFELQYFNSADKRFEPIPGAGTAISLPNFKFGLHQSGYSVQFMPHAGLLRGIVTFRWKLGHIVIAKFTRATTRGHKPDSADPRGYSHAYCRIP
jgi:hypothetical protein